MKHYNDEIIEQFILNADSLDAQTRNELYAHCEECADCRVVLEYFAEFYNAFNTGNKSIIPAIDEFVTGLYPVIPVSVFNVHEHREPKVYMTVLAAMSSTQGSDRFRSVATLASEEQQAVVRILQDNNTKRLRIYVITDDPSKKSHAVLSFPEISVDIVTDSRGQIEVDNVLSDWKDLKGVLRLTVAEHSMTADQLFNGNSGGVIQIEGGLHEVTVTYRNNKLHIATFKKKHYAPDLNVAVISEKQNVNYFIPLTNGKGEYMLSSLPDSFMMRLYC